MQFFRYIKLPGVRSGGILSTDLSRPETCHICTYPLLSVTPTPVTAQARASTRTRRGFGSIPAHIPAGSAQIRPGPHHYPPQLKVVAPIRMTVTVSRSYLLEIEPTMSELLGNRFLGRGHRSPSRTAPPHAIRASRERDCERLLYSQPILIRCEDDVSDRI